MEIPERGEVDGTRLLIGMSMGLRDCAIERYAIFEWNF